MPRPIFAKLNLLMIPYDHNLNCIVFYISKFALQNFNYILPFWPFGHVKTRAAVGHRKEHKVKAKEGVQIGALKDFFWGLKRYFCQSFG